MSKRLRGSLFFSLLVHAILFWILHDKLAPTPAPPSLPITIETRPAQARPGKVHGQVKPHRSAARLDLRRFRPSAGTPTHLPNAGHDATADISDGGWSDDDWGNRGGSFAELEHASKYQRLFTEIRGLFFYPGRLARHDIAGTVNTRLYFTAESRCDWSHTRVNGAHPFLRFYTVSLFKKLCALENLQHMHFKRGQYVDVSFTFAIVGMPETDREQESRDQIVGNVLTFYRSYGHSSLEYRIGPLQGYLFAPVVVVNFPWIFENWDTYVHGLDPFREFRDAN